jgi:hypothetical protein
VADDPAAVAAYDDSLCKVPLHAQTGLEILERGPNAVINRLGAWNQVATERGALVDSSLTGSGRRAGSGLRDGASPFANGR